MPSYDSAVDLFGRDEVMRSCVTLLRAATGGHGRVLLLTGEAGIGKTTLARSLAALAAEDGSVVRWSGCWDGGVVPLAPWIEVLRVPGGDACGDVSLRLLGGDEDGGAEPSAGTRARLRLFAAVVDALRASSHDHAQLVVIDDLHLADAASIDLLCTVATQLATMRVLVIGTYRHDEVSAAHPLSTLSGPVERVELRGLGPDDVGRMLDATLDHPPSPDVTMAVTSRTGGNPLLVAHLARLLASGAPLGVPGGAREMLMRRLARMPSDCNEVLGVAAVLGPEFDPGVVAAVLGLPEDEALASLDSAAAADIAQPIADRPGVWAFTHGLLHLTRYELLSSAERMTLHRAVCDVLETTGRASAATLAHHAFRGRFDSTDVRPASFALAAANEARSRLGTDEAERLYEEALSRAPAGDAGDAVRGDTWVGLGEIRLRTDDALGAAEAFEAAASLARQRDDPDLLAHAALGFGAGLGGFEIRLLDQRQTALLEEATAALDDRSPLRPWVLARLSVAMSFVGSEDRRVGLADEALALARARQDHAAVGAALASRCDAIAGPAFAAERSGLASEITAIGLRLGERRLELLGRRLRVAALAELCDIDALDAEIAAFERSAAVLGDPLYTWYGPLWRAMRAVANGELSDAHRWCDEAAAIGVQAGSGNAQVLTLVVELFIGLAGGTIEDFHARVAALSAVFPELLLLNSAPMLTYTHSVLDMPGWRVRALEVIQRVGGMPMDAEWLCTIAPLTGLVETLDLPDAAADLYERFAPFAGLGVVEGIAAIHRGATDRYLMVLAAMVGEEQRTLEHLERALAVGARVGQLVLADAQRAGAAALRRLGDEHSHRAATLEAEARQVFERLGLPATPLGERSVASTVPWTTASLVEEGDAWAVTWDEKTVRVRDAKGVRDLSALLSRPGRETHVRQLDGVADEAGRHSRQPMLDDTAVASYRERLRDLEDDLDEADSHGDVERAAMLAAERDAVVAQLARAFGIGGRERTMGPDIDERLRKAVSGRIKASIERIEQLHPALGRHLRNSVRTGTWCSYVPERPVEWKIVHGSS